MPQTVTIFMHFAWGAGPAFQSIHLAAWILDIEAIRKHLESNSLQTCQHRLSFHEWGWYLRVTHRNCICHSIDIANWLQCCYFLQCQQIISVTAIFLYLVKPAVHNWNDFVPPLRAINKFHLTMEQVSKLKFLSFFSMSLVSWKSLQVF